MRCQLGCKAHAWRLARPRGLQWGPMGPMSTRDPRGQTVVSRSPKITIDHLRVPQPRLKAVYCNDYKDVKNNHNRSLGNTLYKHKDQIGPANIKVSRVGGTPRQQLLWFLTLFVHTLAWGRLQRSELPNCCPLLPKQAQPAIMDHGLGAGSTGQLSGKPFVH